MNLFTFSKNANQSKFRFTAKSLVFLSLLFLSFFKMSAQVPGMSKLSIQLLLNLNGGSQNTADGVVAVFASGFSSGIGNEDSYKFTNIDENLAINCGGALLSIEGRPTVAANDTLPLAMWKFRQTTYCLKLDGSDFLPTVTAVIKDKYLNQESIVDLAGSTVLAFNINSDSASFARNRFMIVFKSASTLPLNLTDINAYKKDKGVQVSWTVKTETNVHVYEIERSVNGQSFSKAATIQPKGREEITESYSWYDAGLLNGNIFYRIKVIEKTGTIKYSPILRVNGGNENSNITVFPNPVKGNTIGLQLNNIAQGDYTVILVNSNGQKIYTKALKYNGGSSSLMVHVDRQLRSGLYTLQLRNLETLISKTVIVQ